MDPETNEVIGRSKNAATMGVMKSIQCRWMYLFPIFFTSPILEFAANKVGIMPKGGILKKTVDLAFIICGLSMAMPVCAGWFE